MENQMDELPCAIPQCDPTSSSPIVLESHIGIREEIRPETGVQTSEDKQDQNWAEKVIKDLGELLCCDKCSYKTLSANHLRKHTRAHTYKKPSKCSHLACDWRLQLAQNLRLHLQLGRCRRTEQPQAEFAEKSAEKRKNRTRRKGRILKCNQTQISTAEFWDIISLDKMENNEGAKEICTNEVAHEGSLPVNRTGQFKVHTVHEPFAFPIDDCGYRSEWPTDRMLGPCKLLECNANLESSSSFTFACMLCDFIGDSELSALTHARQHKPFAFSY